MIERESIAAPAENIKLFEAHRMADQLGRILFPIDFSNRCVLAARHVKTWLDRFGAALDILHVVNAKALGLTLDEVPNVLLRRTADMKHF